MSDELDSESVNQSPKETAGIALRDPVTGKFLKGTKAGPGRPKGLKDKLNVQVISTLEKIWAQRGEEVMEHLASTKPEVLAGLVARLIPQDLATQAINGDDETEKSNSNQEVTIRLVQQVSDTTAITHSDIPNVVEGELLPADTTH